MLIPKQALARLLAATVKVVESRNTIPILSTVRLVASGGKLTATATDLDIEAQASTEVEGDLSVCVDAKLLAGIVGKIQGDMIDVETSDKSITVKSGRSKFKLETLPVEDYPSLDHGTFTTEFTADLSALVKPVAFAQSSEQNRFYLCGVLLKCDEGRLAVCATDGHRLATVKGSEAPVFDDIIIPTKTVALIPHGSINVSLSAAKIRFTADDVTITSRLIDGTYPDFERVIPRNNESIVNFDGAVLRAAAARVALISSERGNGVKLTVGGAEIALSVRGTGEAEDAVPSDYEGEPVEVGLNSQYLADILGNMPDGQTTMSIADGGSPVLFTSAANPDLRMVGMPMRV